MACEAMAKNDGITRILFNVRSWVLPYIDSDHLCYIYLASLLAQQELSPDSLYLVP